jgi:hypothetical protein
VRAFGACLMEWRRRRKLWRDGWMTKRISIDSLVYLSIQQPTVVALACEVLRDKRVIVPRERVLRSRLGLLDMGWCLQIWTRMWVMVFIICWWYMLCYWWESRFATRSIYASGFWN